MGRISNECAAQGRQDYYPDIIDIDAAYCHGSASTMTSHASFTAFVGARRLLSGPAADVARAVAAAYDNNQLALIFDDQTGRQVDFDLRFDPANAAKCLRLPATAPAEPAGRRGRGRPRLGVVAREVTLLPRHWEWLANQPGGASAALRRLVEEARRRGGRADDAREKREAVYRVMSALAGDEPGFEEASRALFANDDPQFDNIVATWPADIGDYISRLATTAREARSQVQP